MAKYEVDRFESPPDPDLVCCICQCILDQPLESPCQHVFCKICIETWLTNRKNCPNCRKNLRISKLKPVLPIVRNMINRLIIRCDNFSHGCVEGIKLEYYDAHSKQCGFIPLKCMNTGCEVTVLRKDMLAHERECHFRLVVCRRGCGFPVAADQEQNHSCVAVLKANMAAMEEKYYRKYKSLAAAFTKLQKKVEMLETNLRQDVPVRSRDDPPRSRAHGNEDTSSDSIGSVTPVPDHFREDEPDSQRSTDSYDDDGDRSRERQREDPWDDSGSDDSFPVGRRTPVNTEDQHSGWSSWLNSESDDPSLGGSAVDALLASDGDSSPPPRRLREADGDQRTGEVNGGRRTGGRSSPDEPYEGSMGRRRRLSPRRTSPQSDRAHHGLRSSRANDADSTSNVDGGEASSGRDEDGVGNGAAAAAVGQPPTPDSSVNSDNLYELAGSDLSRLSSVRESACTSGDDASPPPVSFHRFLNTVAQMNSSSDFTWSPSSDTVGPTGRRARSPGDDNGRERVDGGEDSQSSPRHRVRDDFHRRQRRRRRSTVYYSSDEDLGSHHSSRKRSRKR